MFRYKFTNQNIKFDLIFVDPPYDYDVYEKILNKVSTLNLLNDNGLIILEHRNLKLPNTYLDLTIYKERNYGNKSISIYKKYSKCYYKENNFSKGLKNGCQTVIDVINGDFIVESKTNESIGYWKIIITFSMITK